MGRHDAIHGGGYDESLAVATEIHRLAADQHLLLLTDFDGTLSELVAMPDEATVSTAVRAEMAALSALDSVTFGVVSGRRLVDVEARVHPVAEFVAGLHGLEIRGVNAEFHHQALHAVVPVVDGVVRLARRQLSWCPGIYIEDKAYAVTCHVRLSPRDLGDRALEEFEALARPQLEARVLRALAGARALELLPCVDWHKGRAVAWIRERVSAHISSQVRVVYLGDDRTDEDAFAALREEDIAIGVGERPHTPLIDWRLAGPASVGRLFGHLARLRE